MDKLTAELLNERRQNKRLAEIRAQWLNWSALTDTSTWESTFFFELLDQKNRQIRRLKQLIQRQK